MKRNTVTLLMMITIWVLTNTIGLAGNGRSLLRSAESHEKQADYESAIAAATAAIRSTNDASIHQQAYRLRARIYRRAGERRLAEYNEQMARRTGTAVSGNVVHRPVVYETSAVPVQLIEWTETPAVTWQYVTFSSEAGFTAVEYYSVSEVIIFSY